MFYTAVFLVIPTEKNALIRCLNNTYKINALGGLKPTDLFCCLFLNMGVSSPRIVTE